MIKITQEELIQYMYNETSELKTSVIQAALETDWDLREAYEKLLAAQQNLNEVRFSPRSEVVDRILAYSAKKQQQVHSL